DRLAYDGSVADEPGFVVMGGAADKLAERVRAQWAPGMSLPEVLALAVQVLAGTGEEARTIETSSLEAAVLDRTRARRTFRRLSVETLTELLVETNQPAGQDQPAEPTEDEATDNGSPSAPDHP